MLSHSCTALISKKLVQFCSICFSSITCVIKVCDINASSFPYIRLLDIFVTISCYFLFVDDDVLCQYLVSKIITKYQKDNKIVWTSPCLFSFSLSSTFFSLGFIFCIRLSKLCYLDLAEHSRRRLVPVGNTTLAVWVKYPAVLTIDHFGAVAGDLRRAIVRSYRLGLV